MLGALLCSTTGFAAQIGVYHWGGVYPHSISEGVERIAALGGTVARVTISARSPIDYQTGETCSDDFSLPGALDQPDLARALGNPRISTFILTAYDGLTFHCGGQQYFDPSFYSDENTAALVDEYANFTVALLRRYPGKRFILDNWESDNAIFCGAAYSYAKDAQFRSRCDASYPASNGVASPTEALRGLRMWLQARIDGVKKGRMQGAQQRLLSRDVLLAAEMNIVRALSGEGLPSVLYDVLPGLDVDYVSYSSYESINSPDPASQLTADLNTIRAVTGQRVMIGEFGFTRANSSDALALEDQVVNAAAAWGVDYSVVWNLFDQSATDQYGLYDINGQPTPYASYFSHLFHAQRQGPPVVRGRTGGFN